MTGAALWAVGPNFMATALLVPQFPLDIDLSIYPTRAELAAYATVDYVHSYVTEHGGTTPKVETIGYSITGTMPSTTMNNSYWNSNPYGYEVWQAKIQNVKLIKLETLTISSGSIARPYGDGTESMVVLSSGLTYLSDNPIAVAAGKSDDYPNYYRFGLLMRYDSANEKVKATIRNVYTMTGGKVSASITAYATFTVTYK